MAEVGTYYITIMPEMSHFTNEVKSALGDSGKTGGKSFAGKFSDVVKGSAIGTALGGLASKAGAFLVSGLDAGIKRYDTLSNYPKVMKNLGYSTEEASKSIKTISDHLVGLPSSTDEVVRLTQSIADSTDDLGLATDAALGFSDMLTAAGASTAEVSTATDVFNRILGKQSATAAQWQSLTSVMPAELNTVAEYMLGAGKNSTDLYNALEDGTVGWQDFLQSIADLDKSGYVNSAGEQMASTEQRARDMSAGIGTAIHNITNRIGKGWAAILDVLGQSNISSAINTMSNSVANAMVKISEGLQFVKDKIGQTKIAENLGKIGKAIADAFGSIAESVGDKLPGITDKLVDLIDKGLQWVVDHGDLVASLLTGIATAMAFKGVVDAGNTIGSVVTNLGELAKVLPMVSKFGDIPAAFTLAAEAGGPLSGMFSGLGSVIGFVAANPLVLIVGAIAAVVGGLVYFFTQTEKGREIWGNFCNGLMEFGTNVANDIKGGFDQIKQNLEDNKVQWEQFKTNLATWNENIRQNVADKWESIKTSVSNQVKEAKDNLVKNWQESQRKTAEWNENVRQNIADRWESIKTTISDKAGEAKDSLVSKWRESQRKTAEWNESIRQNASDKWDEISKSIGDKASDIKTSITDAFSNAKTKATDIFTDLKTGITDKLESARETLSGIVDRIKGLFNFSWSLPAPKLPHITWGWQDVGGIVSIPSFNIDWYAKGGVFDSATLIGIGERGKEAALPLNAKTYSEIARGISGELGTGVTITGNTFVVREEADINKIADALDRKIRRERMAMA